MQRDKLISNKAVQLIKQGDLIRGQELMKQAFEINSNLNIKKNLLLANKKIYINNINKKDYKSAIKYLKQTIELDSENIDAILNMANIYFLVGDFNTASEMYMKALELQPNNPELASRLLDAKQHMCDWKDLDKLVNKIEKENPFANLIRLADEKENLKIAKKYSRQFKHKYICKKHSNKNANNEKIKIGFLSDGFRNFPTGYNLIKVLENFDKSKIKIYCYSWGRDDKSDVRKRFKIISKFIDINNLSNKQAAEKIAEDKIDVLIDLKGYTINNRFEILSFKPSPIQVSYLGFPGTTGANFIDYVIADKVVIPPSSKKYFSEKVVYLNGCYRPIETGYRQLKNKKQKIGNKKIIFASFNQSYKITPEIFKAWCEILKAVPSSVLWQLKSNNFFYKNLSKYAKFNGIDPKRIILKKEINREKHLERLKKVTLALDTFPTNGHTTTVDCLISGVPVVTLKGSHFCSRVSESVLNSFDLNKLIANDLDEYKKLAVKYSNSPPEIKFKKNLSIKNYANRLEYALLKIYKNGPSKNS